MIEILKQFSKKSGVGILLSSSFIKLINLLVIVFVVKLLDQDEYGNIGYAQGVLNFIFPFIGMGASQSLLLFAGKTDSFSEKNQFFTSAFIYGGIISIFIGVLAILFSSTLSSGLPLSQNYIILLSFNFISLFIYDLVKAFSRVLETHQLYIRMEYLYGILTILSTLILSTLFGGLGYVVALIISPLFVGLFFLFYLIKKLNLKLNFDKKLSFDFWKYGIYESIGIASAQILFSIDIVNIGSILHSANDVAGYKIASLIPFSLAVIPNSFLTTDYVKIVQNRSNKEYLKTLIFGYMKLFSIISFSVIVSCYFFADYLLGMFKPEYRDYAIILQILSISVFGNFVLRIPFSNLLTAIKKANINMGISIFVLVLNLVLNYFMIHLYGVKGAAISTTIVIWIYGILASLFFYSYYRKL